MCHDLHCHCWKTFVDHRKASILSVRATFRPLGHQSINNALGARVCAAGHWRRSIIDLFLSAFQMICTSCCQSCQKVSLTRAPNVPNATLRSGGRRWSASFRAAFITSSPHCSTPARPPTCCVTNRFGGIKKKKDHFSYF